MSTAGTYGEVSCLGPRDELSRRLRRAAGHRRRLRDGDLVTEGCDGHATPNLRVGVALGESLVEASRGVGVDSVPARGGAAGVADRRV